MITNGCPHSHYQDLFRSAYEPEGGLCGWNWNDSQTSDLRPGGNITPASNSPAAVVPSIAVFNLELESIHEVMLSDGKRELRVTTMGRFDRNSDWIGTD